MRVRWLQEVAMICVQSTMVELVEFLILHLEIINLARLTSIILCQVRIQYKLQEQWERNQRQPHLKLTWFTLVRLQH